MKRFGPPMIDRRLKRQQTRREVERRKTQESAEGDLHPAEVELIEAEAAGELDDLAKDEESG